MAGVFSASGALMIDPFLSPFSHLIRSFSILLKY